MSPMGATALLLMDFQEEIVQMVPEPQRASVLDKASRVLNRARAAGVPVLHVVVCFREGYPEVHAGNKSFSALRAAGRLLADSAGAGIAERLQPLAGEPVVVKRRTSAFFGTELDTLLGAASVKRLVLMGLVTGGVVISTVRWAADRDYELVVVSDACADPDPEVHRVLMEKLIPRQATVVTAEEVISTVIA